MKLNVVIFSIWLSAGIPSWVMGQSVTEAASDTVPTRYEKMMTRRMEGWKRLIPDHRHGYRGRCGNGGRGV